MSVEEQQETSRGRFAQLWYRNRLAVGLVGAVVVLIVASYAYLASRSGQAPPTRPGDRGGAEDSLVNAQRALAKETDAATCQAALQQIGSYLSQHPDKRPAGLTSARAAPLRQRFGLDGGEVAEIEGGGYSLLDAHYLDRCFLFRDAARSLEVKGLGRNRAVQPTPLDRAEAAFGWAVREVRLKGHKAGLLPPSYTVRLGWGTPLERALVFLALLEQGEGAEGRHSGQPDLLGCLLFLPGKPGEKPRLWACGVVPVGGKDVYLFDPRLGLPLPGPGGKGVATLAQVRKDPAVLAQLNIDDRHRYDVTAEQARSAEAFLVCPLSALAPRMRALQDQFFPPLVQVRLARDPEQELDALRAAVRASGDEKAEVRVWKEGTGLLRNFLPPEDGGVDRVPPGGGLLRKQLLLFAVVPWDALPPLFRIDPEHPLLDPELRNLHPSFPLGQQLLDRFSRVFIASSQPGMPRDLLLRGKFSQATGPLVEEYRFWEGKHSAPVTEDLVKDLKKWVEKAIHAYANLKRAGSPEDRRAAGEEVSKLWKLPDFGPVQELLMSAQARPRGAEVTYLLGLCMHEEAERLQARADLEARAGGAPDRDDAEKARKAWGEALLWWTEYDTRFPDQPGHAVARRLRGRAEAMRGDWKAAAASWEKPPASAAPLEQLASLYLAKQARGQHQAK